MHESINSNQSLDILNKLDADLFISISGNEIFKKKLIDIPHHGIINLHSASFQKYRGLMPSFWVLKNKEKQTGVTVFFVDEGIDSGPILVQKKLLLGELSQWRLIEITKNILVLRLLLRQLTLLDPIILHLSIMIVVKLPIIHSLVSKMLQNSKKMVESFFNVYPYIRRRGLVSFIRSS